MKTRITINGPRLRSNRKHERTDPVIRVQTGKEITYSNRVEILDAQGEVAAVVMYDPGKPMSCGAVAWVECPNGARHTKEG